MEGRLPRVFRCDEALFVADDLSELDDYARGLWWQWRALDKKIDEPAAQKYPKETIKAAAAWLMDAYVAAEAPIPYELSRLVRAIIKPKRDASTSPVQAGSEKAYWKAIEFEAIHPGSEPATLYAVAKHLIDEDAFRSNGREQKSAESTVKSWRKLPHYKANVQLFRREKADNHSCDITARPNSKANR